MSIAPSASYSLTVRFSITNRPGMLGHLASAIGAAGGDIGAVDLVESSRDRVVRDITIKARDSAHASDRTFLMHLGGKIEIHSKVRSVRATTCRWHTPPASRVCLAIPEDVRRAFSLTIKQNAVAVVTDGTAVLGLGDMVAPEVAREVARAAQRTGVARRGRVRGILP